MTLPKGTMIGKYRIRRRIAEGGMAEIYLCTFQGPEGFEKEVAIKRIRSFLAKDPTFVRMFVAEAQLASRLNHANVVQIFDFGKHQDSYYLAMEYVWGQSLWATRKRARQLMRPFPPKLVAHIGAQVARGLHYAHTLTEKGKRVGLVHRDVTPHNVLLSYHGEVKLADFGIAKAENELTVPGTLKGKFAYMSPEQATGANVDARTDVFALGIVLWEMLTGVRLFEGDSDVAVLRAVRESQIAPPARLNSDVEPELDCAVMTALQRDLAERHQSAEELERALAQYLIHSAKRVEDTDVGGFLRGLFEQEASAGIESSMPMGKDSAHLVAVPVPDAVKLGQALSGPAGTNAPTQAASAPGGPRVATADPREARSAPGDPAQASSPADPSRAKKAQPAEAASALPLSGEREEVSLSIDVEEAQTDVAPKGGRGRLWLASVAALGIVVVIVAVKVMRLPSYGRSKAGATATSREEREDRAPSASFPMVVLPPQASLSEPVEADANRIDAGTPALALALPEPLKDGEGRIETSEQASLPGMGTLTIKAVPWAKVSIDGKKMGEVSGTQSYRLKPGKHKLHFEHLGRGEERVFRLRKNEERVEEYHVSAK